MLIQLEQHARTWTRQGSATTQCCPAIFSPMSPSAATQILRSAHLKLRRMTTRHEAVPISMLNTSRAKFFQITFCLTTHEFVGIDDHFLQNRDRFVRLLAAKHVDNVSRSSSSPSWRRFNKNFLASGFLFLASE